MLVASDSVYAYSGGNGSIARGDDYPAYYKNGSQEIDKWRMYLVSVLHLQPFD